MMQEGDFIARHISKIENMAQRLHDLGEHIPKSMQFTKI
jgi:hypothetical protein